MTDETKLRSIYDVLHAIHDQCEDEGDRIYLGSTNDRHTMLRQLRRMEKLIPAAMLYPDAAMTPEPAQPAESPEARARKMLEDRGCFDNGPSDWVRVDDVIAILAATTARPTERGAVEDGQDRKFAFRDGQFVNRVSGEAIPKDEPIIIFRARDWHSLDVLSFYQGVANEPHHVRAIQDRINEFQAFKDEHPDRMKEPGITRHIRLNDAALTPPVTVAATDQAGEVVEKIDAIVERVTSGFRDDVKRIMGKVKTDYRDNLAVALFEARYGMNLGAWSNETQTYWLNRADEALAALATQPATWQQPELPMDVRRLVVAARRALDANDWASTGKRDRMRTLDKAVEAFSSRVDYDDQPATGRTDQVADAGKPIATGRTMGVSGDVDGALRSALTASTTEVAALQNGGER